MTHWQCETDVLGQLGQGKDEHDHLTCAEFSVLLEANDLGWFKQLSNLCQIENQTSSTSQDVSMVKQTLGACGARHLWSVQSLRELSTAQKALHYSSSVWEKGWIIRYSLIVLSWKGHIRRAISVSKTLGCPISKKLPAPKNQTHSCLKSKVEDKSHKNKCGICSYFLMAGLLQSVGAEWSPSLFGTLVPSSKAAGNLVGLNHVSERSVRLGWESVSAKPAEGADVRAARR